MARQPDLLTVRDHAKTFARYRRFREQHRAFNRLGQRQTAVAAGRLVWWARRPLCARYLPDLIERNQVVAAVVELGRAGDFMRLQLLGVFAQPAVEQSS